MTSRYGKWLMSSPPAEWVLNQTRSLLIGAVQQGPLPRHIAFVMDGNRRYAREQRLETVEGHHHGFEALARVLEVSFKAGVEVVTVYAFSIENFKRSKYEVDGLMDMAKIKLTQLAQHGELLDRYGAKVRVIGERSMLKPDVIEAIERAERLTAHNEKCVLNICFPYTSREEITTGIKQTVEEYSKPITPSSHEKDRRNNVFQEERIANIIRSQHLSDHADSQQQHLSPSSSTASFPSSDLPSDTEPEHETSSIASSVTTLQMDSPSTKPTTVSSTPIKPTTKSPVYPNPEQITPDTLNAHMYTANDPPLDLLIRTSGVARLSDFMLWQCHEETQIVFLDILWPQFDLWTFLPVLWEWQWRARKLEAAKKEREPSNEATSERQPGSTKTKSKKSRNNVGAAGVKVA